MKTGDSVFITRKDRGILYGFNPKTPVKIERTSHWKFMNGAHCTTYQVHGLWWSEDDLRPALVYSNEEAIDEI
jgi:hypothetical protein